MVIDSTYACEAKHAYKAVSVQGAKTRGVSSKQVNSMTTRNPPTSMNPENTEVRDLISLTISIGSLCLWFASLWTIRIWWVSPNLPLGLLQVVPPLFWVSLLAALGSIAINFRSRKTTLFLFQLFALIMVVIGTPVLVEPSARQVDAWAHLAAILQLTHGSLPDPSSTSTNWVNATLQTPGNFLFHATFFEIANPFPYLYMQVFPLISVTIFLFGYYAWVRKETMAIGKLSSVLVLFSNLWINNYLGPQSYALMLIPPTLIVLRTMHERSLSWRAATILIWAGLSISHLPTTLMLLTIVWAQFFILLVTARKFTSLTTLCIMTIIYVGSSFYNAPTVFNQDAIAFSSLLFTRAGRSAVTSGLVPSHFLSDPIFFLGRYSRLGTFLLGGVGSVLWILWAMKKRNPGVPLALSWLVVSALFTVLSIGEGGSSVLGGYLTSRSLGLFFVLVPLLLARLVTSKSNFALTLVARVLMVLCTVGITALYPVENQKIISVADLANTSFLFGHVGNARIFATQNFSPYLTQGQHLDFYRVGFQGISQDVFSARAIGGSVLVSDDYAISPPIPNLVNLNKYVASIGYNRIYDNGTHTDMVVV